MVEAGSGLRRVATLVCSGACGAALYGPAPRPTITLGFRDDRHGPGHDDAHATFERVALSGTRLIMGSFSSFDPACRSPGRLTVGLIDPPGDGNAQTGPGEDLSSFSLFGVRARRNTRKRPAILVFHAAMPSYTGPNGFWIERVDPRGNVGRTGDHVTVR